MGCTSGRPVIEEERPNGTNRDVRPRLIDNADFRRRVRAARSREHVRDVPVEIVGSKDSGQARLVTRAIDPAPFADLRRLLPDTIPVRTVAPDATSSPGIDFCNTTGVRQTSPRALYPAMVVLDPTARGPSTPCTGAWGAGPARPRPGAPS